MSLSMLIRGNAPPNQFHYIEKAGKYSDAVRKNNIPCDREQCPSCQASGLTFKRHEARERKFRLIIDMLIEVVICLVIRWKCPVCGVTFTQYPDFALPHKRFILPTLIHYCTRYLADPDMTYRRLFIPDTVGYSESEKQLFHTSVHRWVPTFNMPETLRAAQELILQKNPDSTVCRDGAGFTVCPRKYRSSERKALLERCFRLLLVEGVFKKTFGRSIFPRFATRSAFT